MVVRHPSRNPVPNSVCGAVAARGGASVLLAALVCGVALAQPQPAWVAHGPSPNTRGQVENIKEKPVTGAVNAVVVHPTNADVVYVGAVNGGVWTTADATAASPTWRRLTDDQQSLSIGALEMDPKDASHKTLVAGIGRFSSYIGDGGPRTGILRTTDGGATWTALDGCGTIKGLNVSGVAPRGDTIVITANAADAVGKAGVWRSTDTGATWKQLSGAPMTGLPVGASATLAGNAKHPARLFIAAGSGAKAGVYLSNDTGGTWKRVSPEAMNNQIAAAANVKIAVGADNAVYVAVVSSGDEVLSGVFRSGDGGTNWAAMGVPETADGVGIHPGGQGGIHLSIAADPTNHDLVYVGGDRQNNPFPNVIGAKDYSGRLFRGDASKPAGQQWAHLTHAKNGGGGTANTSAPHADSRAMRVAADGVLIECDDGGVYRRTKPQENTGDWFSMNGNLAVTEFHAVAYDANAKVVIGGSQDTGTPEQVNTISPLWRSVATADGGCVAVDDRSAAGQSTRYSSNQFLGSFRRRAYNGANALQSEVFLPLTVLDGGNPLQPQFYTPIRLNTVDRVRMVIGAANGVYESSDRGDTLTALAPTVVANGTGLSPLAYGAKGNPDVLYVGSGGQVFVRTKAGEPLAASAYAGGFVVGVSIHPGSASAAFAVSANRVSRTTDAGATWTDVSGNLATAGAGRLRSVAYVDAGPNGAVAVGADGGVFLATGPSFNAWAKFGTGLAHAPVFSLEHDPADSLLLAGTLGRGAWTISVESLDAKAESPKGPDKVDPPPAGKKEPKDMGPFQLRPGLVVAADRKAVYVMAPRGGVDALNVADGKPLWQSEKAARPLGVVGARVLAQADTGEGRDFKVVPLESATGKAAGEPGTMTLPQGVKATVQATSQGDFAAVAAAAAGEEAVVSWQFTERPRRALPPGTPPALTPPGGGAVVGNGGVVPPPKKGSFRINLTTGATGAAVGTEIPPSSLSGAAQSVPPTQRLANAAGKQLFSSDRRHILVSEQADLAAWESYKLTVFDAAGTRLGEFRSHLAAVPFFVADRVVIFETTPYRRKPAANEKAITDEDGLIDEPAKVRAISLETGKEVWSRAVREAVYRGPLPP